MSDIEGDNFAKCAAGRSLARDLVRIMPEARGFREARIRSNAPSEIAAAKRAMLSRADSFGLNRQSSGSLCRRSPKGGPEFSRMIDGEPEPPRAVAIYALLSTDDDIIRYIGKTEKPRRRLQQHIADAEDSEFPKDRWITGAHRAGSLKMTIIEWTMDWQEAERRWIKWGRSPKNSGFQLFNATDGG